MPWESQPPLAAVNGFKAAVGQVVVTLGYAVYPHAILLFAHLTMPAGGTHPWRYHWTSKEAAMEAAEQLAAECDEYLDAFNAPRRPVEDLDFEDFLEHLHARLNNELH